MKLLCFLVFTFGHFLFVQLPSSVSCDWNDCDSSERVLPFNITTVCNTMLPEHFNNGVQIPAQTSKGPYNIQVDKTHVSAGEVLTVTILGTTTFKGVFAMGRKRDFMQYRDSQGKFLKEIGGSFLQNIECTQKPDSAVKHSSFAEKTKAKVECGTFVKNYATFWMYVTSDVITVSEN